MGGIDDDIDDYYGYYNYYDSIDNYCDIYTVLTTGIVKFVTYSQSFCFLITGGVARKSNTDMYILASSIKEFKEIDFQHEILELKRINSLLTSQESQLKKTDLN